MKNMLFVGLALLTVCFVALGQSKEENKLEFSENWELFDDSNFSIQYPDTLKLFVSEKKDKGFTFYSTETSDGEKVVESINLNIDNIEGSNYNLDAYMNLVESQIKRGVREGIIIESTRVSIGNFVYHKLVYSVKIGSNSLKWVQYYRIKDDKAYVITFTCEETQYETYANIAAKIMQTFKLK